ncbi:hydrolase [Arthrobacter sp. MYb222]|nr:hydrolase [Arthrobacter sp. MYb222]
MCDVLSTALGRLPDTSRRRFLQGAGLLAASGTLAVSGMPAASANPVAAARGKNQFRTRIVLLGTSGGPPMVSTKRYGVSTAVVYKDRVYLVDLGLGSQMRLLEAGLGAEGFGGRAFSRVRGIFFTHLHSDHIAEWPAAYAVGSMNRIGLENPEPIHVFGPGDRGSLPRVFPPGREEPDLYNPENPTPGTVAMTGYLQQAFASDFNDRARDSNFDRPETTFSIHDIDLTGIWDVDSEGIPPRLSAPIQVWRDGEVTVSTTLVDHRPTAPAFAYRFDTPDGSVVISGDTGVSENLIDLARECDYLVHEVIDPQFAEDLAATLPPEIGPAVREHLLKSHTSIDQVGRDVAEVAGAKHLVLTHLVPGDTPVSRWRKASRGYSGRLTVGADLMSLGAGSPGGSRESSS